MAYVRDATLESTRGSLLARRSLLSSVDAYDVERTGTPASS
jgi:hypothetical protein